MNLRLLGNDGGWDREFGMMDMYTLLYLKRITSEDLLYSTWNSLQCYMPAGMGGEFRENQSIYTYG